MTNLRYWRSQRGLTQRELAMQARCPREQISQIETGKAHGSVTTLKRIATALGITLDELMRESLDAKHDRQAIGR